VEEAVLTRLQANQVLTFAQRTLVYRPGVPAGRGRKEKGRSQAALLLLLAALVRLGLLPAAPAFLLALLDDEPLELRAAPARRC
jgi:hypothetical protein